MVCKENYLGNIYFTEKYIKSVVSSAVSECIGVAGLNSSNLRDYLLHDVFGKKVSGRGVEVVETDNEAEISVYISAVYGTNLKAVVRSVRNKVYFALADNAGVPVRSVKVYVSNIMPYPE